MARAFQSLRIDRSFTETQASRYFPAPGSWAWMHFAAVCEVHERLDTTRTGNRQLWIGTIPTELPNSEDLGPACSYSSFSVKNERC